MGNSRLKKEWKISTGGSYLVKNPPTSMGFLDGSAGKESACNVGYTGDMGSILGPERPPLEKEMATHSSMLAWKIPWTEELPGLQSMGLQRVKRDWATNTQASNSRCIFSPIRCTHSTLNSKSLLICLSPLVVCELHGSDYIYIFCTCFLCLQQNA